MYKSGMQKDAPTSFIDAPHLLVVDDDARLRGLLEEYLTREGYYVSVAADAAHARALLPLWDFDAVVLDVMMPGENGVALTGWLAQHRPLLPILLLTAQILPQERIAGLEAGAQDYLAKPFEPRELLLRLRNIINKVRPKKESPVFFGEYVWYAAHGELRHQDHVVMLSDQESALLSQLAQAMGDPMGREALAAALHISERHVDVAINRLRKKIEPNAAQPRYILTVRGAGYRLRVEQA